MSKITRYNGNVVPFANNAQAGELFDFGSSVDQNTDLTSLVNANYLRGWGIVGASEFPPLEWFNAQAFTSGQFISYLHQMGIPEWNANQEYPTDGAMTIHNGFIWSRRSGWTQGDEPLLASTGWKIEYAVYQYVVSQLANGDESVVAFVESGLDVAAYDYLIYQVDNRVYEIGSVTGTLVGDFDPDTGVDSGLSGALVQIEAITEARVAGIESDIQSLALSGLIEKSDKFSVMFTTDGSTLNLSQNITVTINNSPIYIASGESMTLPTLTNATDYKVYALDDGTLVAQAWEDAEPANSKWIGGFSTAYSDGSVISNSLWDLGWRPSCNPRAMTLSPDTSVWVDIYLADTAYGLNGYSRPDVTIADGSSPPIIPAIYGGNGSDTYGSLTWFEAWDLAINAGKRLPFWGEFTGFAYGVVEQTAVGTDPATTQYQAGHRSACGVEQVTGVMFQWGADVQGNIGGGWQAITDGRGSVYNSGVSAVRLGAAWGEDSNAGSRAADWRDSPSSSNDIIGFRSVCDHMIL